MTDATAPPEIGIGANTQVEESSTDTAVVRPVVSQPRGPSNDAKGAGGIGPEHHFDLDYTDSRGYRWTGKFSSHVLTIADRAAIGITRATLFGGVPLASLDKATINLLEAQAYLAVALDEAPDWAKDLSKVRDLGVLFAIYKEVASYEATFWGTGSEGSSSMDDG